MLRLLVLPVLAVATFSLAFYATESVQADGTGTHCNTYAPLFCNRYYSGQVRCCAPGIQGKIKAADVNLVSPSTDYTAHWVGITQLTDPLEWAQMGFDEGIDPDGGMPLTPRVYTEFRRVSCSIEYEYQGHGTFGTLWDQMFVYWTGGYYYCANNPSIILYRFDMKRGSLSNPILATAYLPKPYGRFDAESERGNFHAIEPNGTQCFGTNNSCSASTTYGLKTYNQTQNQWNLWTGTPVPSNDAPYNRVQLANYYSFYTSGQP